MSCAGARALLLVALWVHALEAHCPRLCDCKWKGGKESVLCPSANLTRLPSHLDAGTQLLDLNDNPLATIAKDAFASAGLLNLQKIYVSKCRLKTIDRYAFRKLINLVELDISYNFLSSVPSHIFDSVPELRELKLSGNPIQRILNEAFVHVPQLVRLELSDCRLGTVEPRAFSGLENSLEWLKLDRNRLSDVKSATITSLQSLHGLELANNPWNCTCGLRPLREWMLKQNVPYGTPPSCRHPSRLTGRSWERMELDEFACAPEIVPDETESKAEEGENVTLSCRVGGEPVPRVLWLLRNRVLANATSITGKRAYLVRARGGAASLTLLGAEPQDAGLYTCAAENLAGRAEAVVKLAVAKRAGTSSNGGLALAAGATAALLVLAACLLLLGIKAARTKPRAHPPACARHRTDSYEKIEMNHKFNNHVPAASNLVENESFTNRNEPINALAGAVRKRGEYRHVPSQDTEDEAETYDEEMETPTPTTTTENLGNAGWRSLPAATWSLHREQRSDLKMDETDLHIPRLCEYREPRLELSPEANSSCGPSFNAFMNSDMQNKVNNNSTDSVLLQSQTLRRQLLSSSNTRIFTSPTPTSTLANSLDDQNNVTGDPDKNYPDLLEINSLNANATASKKGKTANGTSDKDFAFFTLPRKGQEHLRNNNNNSRAHKESDSQSPLLPGSRYGSSGGESSIGSNSNRRLSIESYSHYPTLGSNSKSGQRSNSFLNLATSANIRGAPSLPGSPASATPLLQLRGLQRAEIARAPITTPTSAMPLTYDYHAAQLERFLEEYRSLQEQLCKMKETCENMTSSREKAASNSRFIDPLLFSNCVSTPSCSEENNPRSILKNRPTVAVTATSGSSVSGNALSDAASPLALSPSDLGNSLSPWTSTNTLLKRLGGTGDFFRS